VTSTIERLASGAARLVTALAAARETTPVASRLPPGE